jgi:hypothetical protein
MSAKEPRADALRQPIKALYRLTLFFLVLTGFGQMPIYNRYYMSDIPGLGWLADFYITRNIHYLGAVVLLALASYVALGFILSKRRQARLSASGGVRAALLTAIVISGGLIVVKNFPYVHFSDGFIIVVNLVHITAVMAFLTANLVCVIGKKKWKNFS